MVCWLRGKPLKLEERGQRQGREKGYREVRTAGIGKMCEDE